MWGKIPQVLSTARSPRKTSISSVGSCPTQVHDLDHHEETADIPKLRDPLQLLACALQNTHETQRQTELLLQIRGHERDGAAESNTGGWNFFAAKDVWGQLARSE